MKSFIKKYIGGLYMTPRFYIGGSVCAALFFVRYFCPVLGWIPVAVLWLFVVLLFIEYVLLFAGNKLSSHRIVARRLSNGDYNPISIELHSKYSIPVYVTIVDETPFQFQKRDMAVRKYIPPRQSEVITYQLRPVKRGEYQFGAVNSFVRCMLQLIQRKYKDDAENIVAVYPSYMQLRKYQILALNHHLTESGMKRQRIFGQSFELEQIKEYVVGDDFRAINWKASSRHQQLMVNKYTEEKSQSIYCVIDKGRLMEMPFSGLSLLDYAINASLVLSCVAMYKEDRAGIICFEKTTQQILPAERRSGYMQNIQEFLYRQETSFAESSFEHLYVGVKSKVKQRSLLLLFTNFTSMEGLQRQLPYLKRLASHHRLLVIFFQNTLLDELAQERVDNVKDIYTQAIGEELILEKQRIVKELQRNGILSLLTLPEQLTVNTINKYLEIKQNGGI